MCCFTDIEVYPAVWSHMEQLSSRFSNAPCAYICVPFLQMIILGASFLRHMFKEDPASLGIWNILITTLKVAKHLFFCIFLHSFTHILHWQQLSLPSDPLYMIICRVAETCWNINQLVRIVPQFIGVWTPPTPPPKKKQSSYRTTFTCATSPCDSGTYPARATMLPNVDHNTHKPG